MVTLNNWMKNIDDSIKLVDIFIPGTHDTMTSSCNERYYKTQNLSLKEQLDIGIRFLDIRLRKEMIAAHREWHSDITTKKIMQTIQIFLEENPSECIIIRFQNANEKKDDYEEYGNALLDNIAEFWNKFYFFTNQSSEFPLLGESRGKIIALECSPHKYNFCSKDNQFWSQTWHDNEYLNIQDLWDGPFIQDKKESIKINIESNFIKKLNLNHISATNGELKFPDLYSDVLNNYLMELISEKNDLKGVQILDYITKDFASNIINANFIQSKKEG